MTGRDLIMYILENKLENEPVIKDGVFIGLVSEKEIAAKYNVGVSTIRAWVKYGWLQGIQIGEGVYIWPLTEKLDKQVRKE